MIEAPHFSPAGARKSGAFPLPEAFFDGTVNRPVLHEAVTAYLANQRQGTAKTKTRSFVSGGNQKPWKQKGTGRARQGSIRSPLWPGGGKVFGPQPRDYRITMPRKVKQLARRSALNARAAEGSLYVVERFEQQSPKTRELVALLEKLGVAERKVLLLTHGVSEALVLSARNLPKVEALPYADAAAYDVLWAEVVIVEEPALAGESPVPFVRRFVPAPRDGAKAPAERPARAAKAEKPKAEKKPVAKKAAAKPKAAKAAPKAKPKPAARKSAAKKPAGKKKGGK
ncbi:MAG: 50S ribosomal protein L4 [Gemmatimonadota bacterium]|nr:50S ribosomal protein L4 [Gemmatimonadota bacterium]MDH5283145.1 50S ribosomal protein L4 [Gemmatimonadota bacterium]